MKVIIVEPGKFARIDEIETGLESYQHVVGGYIQMVYPWDDPVAIVCNEEGKIEGLPLNRAMTDEDGHVWDIIAGTFFICGLGEEDCDSLSDELAEKYLQIFKNPHRFYLDPIGNVIGYQVLSEEEHIHVVQEKSDNKEEFDDGSC